MSRVRWYIAVVNIAIMSFKSSLTLSVAGICALLCTTVGAVDPSATIKNGVVVGTTTLLPGATAAVNKFLGIPFAQSPPVRFAPPQAPAALSAPLMAQSVKASCIQQFIYPEIARNITMGVFNSPPPPAGESEDCLYVNVFAPSSPPPPGGRAVLFWIYGGGLEFGSGTLMAYDGSAFASYQDVILVTHGYRINGEQSLPETYRHHTD